MTMLQHPAPPYDPGKRQAQLVQRLKDAGHRITPQRLAILRTLAEANDHPSAETIFEQLAPLHPTMSLATVYKTLVILRQLGEVQEVRIDELGVRYDGQDPMPHIHVVCECCKEIIDTQADALEALRAEVARRTGCELTRQSLVFYGNCGACKAKGELSGE